jgi:hypothetical protein
MSLNGGAHGEAMQTMEAMPATEAMQATPEPVDLSSLKPTREDLKLIRSAVNNEFRRRRELSRQEEKLEVYLGARDQTRGGLRRNDISRARDQTRGGLRRNDLTMNKHGRVVETKRYLAAKKNPWIVAGVKAHAHMKIKGFSKMERRSRFHTTALGFYHK